MDRVSSRVAGLCLLTALSATPATAAQRAFVASYGSDANTATLCSLQTPCRSFVAAIGVVDSGGEVIALDAGGYGSNITIAKPLTLTANPGFYAGIFATSGIAVRINTSAKVVLRGLDIKGAGADIGIRAGGNVDVENCRISNFGTAGIGGGGWLRVSDTVIRNSSVGINALGFKADIVRSQLLDNGTAGIRVLLYSASFPMSGSADISVSDSVISNNYYGILMYVYYSGGRYRLAVTRTTISDSWRGVEAAAAPGFRPGYEVQPEVRVTIGDSQITGNLSGFVQTHTAVFESMGDNIFSGNRDGDIAGTVAVAPGT